MLNLFYITNRPEITKIAQEAGVDRIFIDMEYIGKDARQGGMDTVQNHHTVNDVMTIRKCLSSSELLVRVNPVHDATSDYESSEDEIARTIDAGADVLMLPMYKSVAEVERFLKAVDGKAKTMLLDETPEACTIMDDVLKIKEVDEIHLGLNDLHLALGMDFMFELLADGTVDELAAKIKASGKPFGFGGIARLGYGTLPAERIITEHYRVGSTRAILSRSFCNADKAEDVEEIRQIFMSEVERIRDLEKELVNYTAEQFEANRLKAIELTGQIVKTIREKK